MAAGDNAHASYRERLARLEEAVATIKSNQESQDQKLTSIKTTLDQMTGGKKMLLAIFAIVGAIGAVIGATATFITAAAKGMLRP